MGKEFILYYYSPTLEVLKEVIATTENIIYTNIGELYFDEEMTIPAGNNTYNVIFNKDALNYDTVAITCVKTLYTPYGTASYNYAKINDDEMKTLTTYVAGFDNAKQMLVTRTFLPPRPSDPPGRQRRKLILTSDF